MTELIRHPKFGEIRTVIHKGEPWFVNQDVCNILGLQRSDRIASNYLDDDEKGLQKMSTPGGPQELLVVSESGLYALIMRSNNPEAKKFRKWVTSEVLPSIRRNGFYVHPHLMTRKDESRLKKRLGDRLDRYLTEDDRRKVAKKFGVSLWGVNSVISGTTTNNAIMQECQRRALLNKEHELNAYHPDRISSVLNKLSL